MYEHISYITIYIYIFIHSFMFIHIYIHSCMKHFLPGQTDVSNICLSGSLSVRIDVVIITRYICVYHYLLYDIRTACDS